VSALVALLSGVDTVAARGAARRLGELKESRGRRSLETALNSPDVALRVGAASALGAIGRTQSRLALESRLADPDWRVRAQAAYALSHIPDRRSTERLVETLARDESALVRNACALALGRIGDPRAIPGLDRALDDESDRVRREAILALERSRDPEAAAKVRRFLADPARRVRIAATIVLGLRRDRDGVARLLAFLDRSDHWEKPALMIALGRIGTEKCGEALARCAADPVRWVRVCALHGLAEMRSPLAKGVARARLSDPSWAVRGAAALALGRVGDASESRELLPLLRDTTPWVRRGAVYALGQVGATGALPELRAALDDPDPEVRLAAIWTLGHLGDVVSAPRLIEMLHATSPQEAHARPVVTEGDGAVRLVSDAGARLFDALIQAVGSLAEDSSVESARRELAATRRRLPDSELDRPARLPTPLGSGTGLRTLRSLFDSPDPPVRDR
jgi:HEAT repeat protein